LLRRLARHPFEHLFHRHAALARLGPQEAEPESKSADTTPGFHKVARLEALQFGRAGRVVRDDKVDVAVEEGLPELFAVRVFADRRAALEEGFALGDLFCREAQVVEARLDRERQAEISAGVSQSWEGGGGRQVDNVRPEGRELFCATDNEVDGRLFECRWPRSEKRRVGRRIRRGVFVARAVEFGVEEKERFRGLSTIAKRYGVSPSRVTRSL
jgi:hypothetical protein